MKLPWETCLEVEPYPAIEVHFNGGSAWKTMTGYTPRLDAHCYWQLPLERSRSCYGVTSPWVQFISCELGPSGEMQMLTCEAISNKHCFEAFGISLHKSECFSLLSPFIHPPPPAASASLSLSLSCSLLHSCSSIIDEVIMIWSQEKCIPVTLNLHTQFVTLLFFKRWLYFIVGGHLA